MRFEIRPPTIVCLFCGATLYAVLHPHYECRSTEMCRPGSVMLSHQPDMENPDHTPSHSNSLMVQIGTGAVSSSGIGTTISFPPSTPKT